MKKIISIFSLVLMVGFSACDKDEEVSPEQAFLNDLKGTWSVSSGGVFVDGTEISDQYTNFSITFNSDPDFKAFEVENGGEAFPQSTDSYEFTGSDFTSVQRRSDDIVMTLQLNDKQLKITFSKLPENTGGRYEGTFGDFEFNLVKN